MGEISSYRVLGSCISRLIIINLNNRNREQIIMFMGPMASSLMTSTKFGYTGLELRKGCVNDDYDGWRAAAYVPVFRHEYSCAPVLCVMECCHLQPCRELSAPPHQLPRHRDPRPISYLLTAVRLPLDLTPTPDTSQLLLLPLPLPPQLQVWQTKPQIPAGAP